MDYERHKEIFKKKRKIGKKAFMAFRQCLVSAIKKKIDHLFCFLYFFLNGVVNAPRHGHYERHRPSHEKEITMALLRHLDALRTP